MKRNTLTLAAIAMVMALATGCTTSTGGRQSSLIEPVTIPRPKPEPKSKNVLALAAYRSPIDLPVRIDRGSARDQALVASYMAQTSPADAVRHYLKLIEERGGNYELCFTRHAFQEALRCAWRSGDPALLRTVLDRYEQQLDQVAREPEPRFVKDIRKFFSASEERLRTAYGSMDPKLAQVKYDVLQKDRSTWLRKHQDAVVGLVTAFRDTPAREWQPEQMDALAVAEVHLADGYIRPDSNLLLLREAEQRAKASDDTSDRSMIRNVAQAFIERTGLIAPPNGRDYLLGMDYQER